MCLQKNYRKKGRVYKRKREKVFKGFTCSGKEEEMSAEICIGVEKTENGDMRVVSSGGLNYLELVFAVHLINQHLQEISETMREQAKRNSIQIVKGVK